MRSVSLFFVLIFISFTSISVTVKPKFSSVESPNRLISLIQSGGYILYMRHGVTQLTNHFRDKDLLDLSDCSTQRNLTDNGLKEVLKVGEVVKKLQIPIAWVKTSPYCRAKHTANAVFGNFIIDEKLTFSFYKQQDESSILINYLKEQMLAARNEKKNVVFVGHSSNLRDSMGVWPKPEGVVAVFKNNGSSIIFKGLIAPNDWISF